MSNKVRAATVIAREENVGVLYLLAMHSEEELVARATQYNREREERMDATRESWLYA